MLDLRQERVNQLFARGASLSCAQELLPLTASRFAADDLAPRQLPLGDEPHIEVWQRYAADAAQQGAWGALRTRLVQLQFPVHAGISAAADYQRATRRGDPPATLAAATGLELEAPERLGLALHPTAVGTLPVISAATRHDFVALLRALAHRNEPVAVPDAVGATLIVGYTNWDRVARLRAAWAHGVSDTSDAAWAEELRAHIRPLPQLYRDSFVLCSAGPYSGVAAAELGLEPAAWQTISAAIRVAHEAAHYTVQRLLGPPQNSLLDELVADFCGMVAAGQGFCADWFLRFMGQAEAPAPGAPGRLGAYLGGAQLSPEAARLLDELLAAAAANLERFSAGQRWPAEPGLALARLTPLLMSMSLEELAADDAPQQIRHALAAAW